MEGKVVQRAECCPINNALYSDIKKDALTRAGEPKRMLQKIDKYVATTIKPISIHKSQLLHEKAKKAEGKKMSQQKQELRHKITDLENALVNKDRELEGIKAKDKKLARLQRESAEK